MTLWVFGYGSLMWNPEFAPAESALARLPDYARSFCMWSIHHRGSEEAPGLVLALDAHPGAECRGLALRVKPEEEDEVLTALRARELVSSAYLERRLPVELEDGRQVEAVAYVVDPAHVQYCGGLSVERQAEVIATARGGRGPNSEYLWSTVTHMGQLGIADAELEALAQRVRTLVDKSLA